MKKQLIATMAVVMGLGCSIATPVQAAGVYSISKNVQAKGCVIVNGKLCNLSDAKNTLEEWCQQIQNGSGNNCSVILVPGCNKPSQPENNTPEVEQPELPEQEDSNNSGNPDNNIPEVEIPALPDDNQPEQDNSGSNTPEVEQPEVDTESLSYAEQVVELVNEERAKMGLSPVELDTEIASAALIRANEIKTSFSHTRPDGRKFSTVLTDNGIRFYGAGENIAWGQRSPEQVMNAWMNSDGHRANILNSKYTKIGVGHYQDAKGINYWVQLFTY